MNTENLNGILAQYVQHCKAFRAAADEGTVWRAVDCFGVNWDIEDSDFPAMFADAMQQAQSTLDNPAVQPIGGLKNLMMRDSEVELVRRECFRWLYNVDGGDISKRRGRAELFADQINGRFRRVFPRMSKYTMNTANAVFFLNLWMPEANFFYHPQRGEGLGGLLWVPGGVWRRYGAGPAALLHDVQRPAARAGELPGDHRPA